MVKKCSSLDIGKVSGSTDPNRDACRYYVPFNRNKIARKPSAPAIEKGINVLNVALQTLPIFYKST